jgi:hypothetical protein
VIRIYNATYHALLLYYAFHSSGSLETRLCNGGVGTPPHHNTMLSISYLISRDFPVRQAAVRPLTAARGWQAITNPRFSSSKRIPALGLPSPVRRRGRQPRPQRRPQRRGERRRRWGCDARASPGSGRVGRRGRCNPHHAGGPGGGRRK